MAKRLARFLALLAASWVVMTITHEFGHLIGGFVSGAVLVDYDVVPWRMPYSVHSPDPHPLITLWGGPIFGVAAPAFLATLFRRPWARFVADFCLIANGGYLALAWLSGDRHLDTPRLLAAGAEPVTIVVFCCLTIGVGYVRFRADCVRFLSPCDESRDGD